MNILQGSFRHQLLEVTGEKVRLSDYRKKDQECMLTKFLLVYSLFTSLEKMLFVIIGDLLVFLNWGSVKNYVQMPQGRGSQSVNPGLLDVLET